MISHTMIGTNDIEKADRFYQKILPPMGGRQIYKSEQVMFWEFEQGGAKFAVSKPFDSKPATYGNGTMVAFQLQSKAQVRQLYAAAIDHGGGCEGEPGERNSGAFYGAYFRDLDGNKVALFYRPPQEG
ncbi:VOC family protein [Kangiella shandongensis]|uniref:VOC family protein n=1 Tax=Kangiella shandongensis TaxID=2763258 RepID=UPI001CBEA1D6|nr:VOC family protein [Kangiella shandongensis]